MEADLLHYGPVLLWAIRYVAVTYIPFYLW